MFQTLRKPLDELQKLLPRLQKHWWLVATYAQCRGTSLPCTSPCCHKLGTQLSVEPLGRLRGHVVRKAMISSPLRNCTQSFLTGASERFFANLSTNTTWLSKLEGNMWENHCLWNNILKCNQMHHPDALFHPGCRPFPSQGPYPTHAKSSGGIKPKIQRSPSYYETWNYIHRFGRKYSHN